MPIGAEPATTVSGRGRGHHHEDDRAGAQPAAQAGPFGSGDCARCRFGDGGHTGDLRCCGSAGLPGARGACPRRESAPRAGGWLHSRHIPETSALHRTRDGGHTFLIRESGRGHPGWLRSGPIDGGRVMTRVDRLPPQSPVAGLRRRRLSFAEVLAQSVSALAPSAAMVVVPSIVLVEAGAATLPAFVAATALVLLVGWCLTQFGRRMAAVGGTYSYTAKGLGPVGALIGGWALLIGYAAVAMAALVGSAAYLAGLFGLAPSPLAVAVLGGAVGLAATLCTIRGIQLSARVALALEVLSIVLVLTVLAVLLFAPRDAAGQRGARGRRRGELERGRGRGGARGDRVHGLRERGHARGRGPAAAGRRPAGGAVDPGGGRGAVHRGGGGAGRAAARGAARRPHQPGAGGRAGRPGGAGAAAPAAGRRHRGVVLRLRHRVDQRAGAGAVLDGPGGRAAAVARPHPSALRDPVRGARGGAAGGRRRAGDRARGRQRAAGGADRLADRLGVRVRAGLRAGLPGDAGVPPPDR